MNRFLPLMIYFSQVFSQMERGHRVCKLALGKRWVPAYRKLIFRRETRQLLLYKTGDVPVASMSFKDKPICRKLPLLYLFSSRGVVSAFSLDFVKLLKKTPIVNAGETRCGDKLFLVSHLRVGQSRILRIILT